MSNKGPKWLANSVFYQVYPQSFYDSNKDGIGDVPGIIQKLDYIKWLGCNALWLNPVFESPFLDGGYDIADYRKVAKRYGTNADIKRLFKQAHKKGIKVILDLVPGHTSIQHKWFKQSCKAEKNKYSDYYIWTDDVLETAQDYANVIGYAQRNGNYIANYYWSQPALNYGFVKPDQQKKWQTSTNAKGPRAVRKEMKQIMRYWMDAGADGFRCDMASSLIKGENFPYFEKINDFWLEVRDMFDTHYPDNALIAEWSYPKTAIKSGFHADFILHCGMPGYTTLFRQEKGTNVLPDTKGNSFFRKAGKGDPLIFANNYMKHYQKIKNKGFISIPTGNHDLPRISLGRNMTELQIVFAFLMTMPGVPFIYYGDEIGMKYLKNVPNREGGYVRTGSRTPMQWDNSKNAGFSKAPKNKLYLPIDHRKNKTNVAAQAKNKNSLLNNIRKLIKLRHKYKALSADGKIEFLYARKNKYPLVYLRQKRTERFIIALNPSAKPAKATFQTNFQIKKIEHIAGSPCKVKNKNKRCSLNVPPISFTILKA